jgi:tetratricopeptide (TPR) repeat protein
MIRRGRNRFARAATIAGVLAAAGVLTAGVLTATWLGGRAHAAPPKAPPPHNPAMTIPEAPAFLPTHRIRFALHVVGKIENSTTKSIIAQLPGGGWFAPDAADIVVTTGAGEKLPVTVLSHDPAGTTIIQFPRRGNDPWYWAYAVLNPGAKVDAPKADAEKFQEGLTFEVRRWPGEALGDWASVREELTAAETVIGNGVAAQVVENCNPVRPNDPRHYASSYRGFLKIEKAGVHRFFLNCEDTAFLFIDGFKVTERVGTNSRITGAVPIRSTGTEIELTAGIHPFEVHHVMGNNPSAIGYATLMWVPPEGKGWTFVPYTAFQQADFARVARIDEAQNKPAAQFVFGIDDTLRSGDGGLAYLVRFAAVGPGSNPGPSANAAPAAGPSDENSLVWDFGDGTTGRGRNPRHVYFQSGDYTVSLKSGDLPPYKTNVHIWPAPGNTSPFSLGTAVDTLAASDWKSSDDGRLNQMLQFLLVCEQPNRWALLDGVAEKLLASPGLDLKMKVTLYAARMDALANQGRAEEGIALGEKVLPEFNRVPSLQVGIRLAIAGVYAKYLKKPADAGKIYESIVNEHRRVEHPNIRIAAIRWGDLYAESGELSRAGECYRLASQLGGDEFSGSSLTGAVTRGGLLRTAEQQLRGGNIQQTRVLLERIEMNYPQQKLEGLYRLLRADTDRRSGRYEEALANYEILLKLTQWSGFHDRALHGLADTYARMGNTAKASEWLDSLEKSYPAYYEKQKLADQRKLWNEKSAAAATASAAPADDGSSTAGRFADFVSGFEPEEKASWGELTNFGSAPALGLVGPHVGLGQGFPRYVGYFDLKRPIAGLAAGGEYWVELWYRESIMDGTFAAHAHMYVYDKAYTKNDYVHQGTARLDRTYGQWRKIGFMLQAPGAGDGYGAYSMRQMIGLVELDGYSIRAVDGRQSDALNNFLRGSEIE